MANKKFTMEDVDKMIDEILKPPTTSLTQKFKGLRLPKLPLLKRPKRIKREI